LELKYISFFYGYAAEKISGFCSDHYEIHAYYDYPSSCARTWYDASGKLNGLKPVTHKDLTHMVYQLLQAEEYLNSHHLCYQDVRPTHIGFRDFDKSYCELVDRLKYPMDAEEVNR